MLAANFCNCFRFKMIFQKKKKIDKKIRAHIFVSGRVQGVFFRQQTKEEAENRGVSGWVKNLEDSKVEAVFEGKKTEVEKMADWMRQGPVWAKVDDFKIIWEDCRQEFKGFEIR